MLIHILYMIGPSIAWASRGRFDAFIGWQFCLLYRYCFTMLPPNNSTGLCDVASSTGSKFNQSGIRWDVSPVAVSYGPLVTQQLRSQNQVCLNRLDSGDVLERWLLSFSWLLPGWPMSLFCRRSVNEHFVKTNSSPKRSTLWKCFTSVRNSGGRFVQCEVSDYCFILFSLTSLI